MSWRPFGQGRAAHDVADRIGQRDDLEHRGRRGPARRFSSRRRRSCRPSLSPFSRPFARSRSLAGRMRRPVPLDGVGDGVQAGVFGGRRRLARRMDAVRAAPSFSSSDGRRGLSHGASLTAAPSRRPPSRLAAPVGSGAPRSRGGYDEGTDGAGVEPGAEGGAVERVGHVGGRGEQHGGTGCGGELGGRDLRARSPGADACRADVAEVDAREVVVERHPLDRLGAGLARRPRVERVDVAQQHEHVGVRRVRRPARRAGRCRRSGSRGWRPCRSR